MRDFKRRTGPVNGPGSRKASPFAAPPAKQQIPVESLPQITCVCGSTNFVVTMQLRFASPLVSPTGQPHIVQVPFGWTCSECGGLNQFERAPGLEMLFPKEEEVKVEAEAETENPPEVA